jgi:hypothetical protein
LTTYSSAADAWPATFGQLSRTKPALVFGRRCAFVASLLPQQLQDLHQLGVDELIAADQIAGLERVVVAFDSDVLS